MGILMDACCNFVSGEACCAATLGKTTSFDVSTLSLSFNFVWKRLACAAEFESKSRSADLAVSLYIECIAGDWVEIEKVENEKKD